MSSYINPLSIEPIFRAAEKVKRALDMLRFCRYKCYAIAIGQQPAHDLESDPARSSGHKRNAPVADP